MPKLKFQHHPLIDGLKVNEDGSQLIYNREPVRIDKQVRKNGHESLRVNFGGHKSISVLKLICEAWNGERDTNQVVCHIGDKKNNHYTNLQWSYGNQSAFKRAIQEDEIPAILADLKSKEKSLKAIAKKHNKSHQSVLRLRRRKLGY
jgi:hypothetical protein